MSIGTTVYRCRWHLLVLWAAATAMLLLLVPQPDRMAGLTTDLLPADSPFHTAAKEMARYFPDKSGLSQVAVVLERSDGRLTTKDLEDAERVAERIVLPRTGGPTAEEMRGVTVRSPRSLASMGKQNPLVSPDGRAAMISLNLPYNHATTRAVRIVNHVHAVLEEFRDERRFAPGLALAVTGSAGYGRDYILATERSHDKIVVVTLVAIIVILLAVYRAPLAALIPLAGIGMATALATKLMLAGRVFGLSGGTAERLFMLVLLLGAGVDYSLLFISRYKEFLDLQRPPEEAFVLGLDASLGAIVSSSATTAAGLSVLCFARFGVFRDVGPAIVLALVTAAVASMTVVPAMVALVGPRLFWPRRPGQLPAALDGAEAKPTALRRLARMRERVWPAVARIVTRRPGWVLLVSLAALAAPGARGAFLTWAYDAQGSLKPTYSAVQGMEMVTRHWSIGEIAPVMALAVADSPQPSGKWASASIHIATRLRGIEGVGDVRGLTVPLGLHVDPLTHVAAVLLGGERLRREFLSADGRAMWLSAVLKTAPQTPSALADAERIQAAVEDGLSQAGIQAKVHLTGPTAETADLRAVTQSDFYRTAAGALAVIFVIVLVLMRDTILSLFMVAATVLSYVATLGLTYWAFLAIGQNGLDWQVEVFLFIVMVAVGQDYNIFFAVRLAQEAATLPPAQATEQALIHTGRVISSCGVIMAATLGSMMAGDVKMLQQLGFALALGMLIDTFVVRPLLIPCFIVLTGRTLQKSAAFIRTARD